MQPIVAVVSNASHVVVADVMAGRCVTALTAGVSDQNPPVGASGRG